MSACQDLAVTASAGVAPALRAVDCYASQTAASAFGRLFGPEGALLPALTILLTLYIAFFAISLLTGRSRLSVSALTPRMITLGLVLTFATSWVAFSQVLWNLAVAGPDWVATLLTGSRGSASLAFADRIDIVFAAIGEAGEAATAGAGAAANAPPPAAGSAGMFRPADIMWLGAVLLLLGTAGVLVTARIALAVLMALGPVFVVLALFRGTRGLTAGWLKGVALTALAPLFVVLGGAITLEMLVPVVSALSQGAAFGEISGRAAMALFLVASIHVALMAMVLKVAAAIVSGWRVFGLAPQGVDREKFPTTPAVREMPPVTAPAPANAATAAHARVVAPADAARDGIAGVREGAAAAPGRRRVATRVSGGGMEPLMDRGPGRARGIGSRFRTASNDSGRAMSKGAGKEKAR